MWWFLSGAKGKVILFVDNTPLRGENGQYKAVQWVKAYPDGRVEVSFDDGSTKKLQLASFSADGVKLQNGCAEDFAQAMREFPVENRTGQPVQETHGPDGSPASTPDQPATENSGGGHWKRNLLVAALCAPLAVGGAVVALPAIGFTSAGIAGGSYAASMMSAAAVANGGGVAAGSVVAVLQSAGAAGLGATATGALAGAGAAVGGGASYVAGKFEDYFKQNNDDGAE